MVALTHTNVNKFERAGRRLSKYQYSTKAQVGKEPVYINELPDEAVVVSAVAHHSKRSFTQTEVQGIVSDYCERGLTVYQLADKYGCHRTTVSKMLKQYGVDVTVRKIDDAKLAQAIKSYATGSSLSEIAKELNSNKSTVQRALIEAGVSIREAKRCCHFK